MQFLVGLIGIGTLAVIATMVFQVVRSGSQGPAETRAIGNAVTGFYGTLMK